MELYQLEINYALSLLQAMKGEDWTEGQVERFTIVLDRIEPSIRFKAVANLSLRKWRPSPDEIRHEAARIEMCFHGGNDAPYPTADETYAEIMWKAKNIGLNGKPHPERPSVMIPGAPSFSHPLVARTVALVGGWQLICSGEANLSEGLAKQIKTIYERESTAWSSKVADMLMLMPCDRDAGYLPIWTPFGLPSEWEEPKAQLRIVGGPDRDRAELVPMPEHIRRAIRSIGAEMPSLPEECAGDDGPRAQNKRRQQEMVDIEHELRSRRTPTEV